MVKNGFVLNSADNVEQMIEYINVLKDSSLCVQMSKVAREKMLNYTKKNNHDKMLSIYYKIANR